MSKPVSCNTLSFTTASATSALSARPRCLTLISPLTLSPNGSLFLTRPTLFDYIAERTELEPRADELFAWIAAGELDVRIGARFALSEAAEAHRALEGRATTGKVLLVP